MAPAEVGLEQILGNHEIYASFCEYLKHSRQKKGIVLMLLLGEINQVISAISVGTSARNSFPCSDCNSHLLQ